MNKKNFKGEVALFISLLCGVISFITFSASVDPNALGENLFWTTASMVFAISFLIGAMLTSGILTFWEKKYPHLYKKIKNKCINKINSLLNAYFEGAEED